MTNPFYRPGSQRTAGVSDLFSTVARRYDLVNDVQSLGLHRLWKRRVADLARVRPGERALDVCCGTGDIAFALARRGATVLALDFSGPMLAAAQRRIAKTTGANRTRLSGSNSAGAGLSPRFLRGDAERLPLPDESVEIVTVGYGLRNLASWQAGLGEMVRVAKPGGRVLVLDFGKPDNALWRTLYFGYLRFIVPVFGLIFSGSADAYAYILESLKRYPAQRGVAGQMRQLGLQEVRVVNVLFGMMSINYGEKPKRAPAP